MQWKENKVLYYLNYFLGMWLLPPGLNLVLLLIGFLLLGYWPTTAKIIMFLGFSSLWLFSSPLIAQHLVNRLQYQYPTLPPGKLLSDKHAAIVVLEASLNMLTPEYGKPTVSESTLARIRYAAYLYQLTKLPVLVSGNDPTHLSVNQADYMADALKVYFDVPTTWKEAEGFNTAQEGIRSTEILKKAGITKIYLVTHAIHIPRAVRAFQNHGIEIVSAPTGYIEFDKPLGIISDFLPSMGALNASAAAIHEYIGLFWYRVYYHF